MRCPCKGHGMSCLWLLLPKPNTGGDSWYEIHRHARYHFKLMIELFTNWKMVFPDRVVIPEGVVPDRFHGISYGHSIFLWLYSVKKWYNSKENNILCCKYFRYPRKINTNMFIILSYHQGGKAYLSSSIIGRVSYLAVFCSWHCQNE